MIRSEVIGFLLFPRADIPALQKALSLTMQENVSTLMKESEPEVVIGFVSATELNHGLIGRDPPSGSADMSMPQLGSKGHGDATRFALVLEGVLNPLQVRFPR